LCESEKERKGRKIEEGGEEGKRRERERQERIE